MHNNRIIFKIYDTWEKINSVIITDNYNPISAEKFDEFFSRIMSNKMPSFLAMNKTYFSNKRFIVEVFYEKYPNDKVFYHLFKKYDNSIIGEIVEKSNRRLTC